MVEARPVQPPPHKIRAGVGPVRADQLAIVSPPIRVISPTPSEPYRHVQRAATRAGRPFRAGACNDVYERLADHRNLHVRNSLGNLSERGRLFVERQKGRNSLAMIKRLTMAAAVV